VKTALDFLLAARRSEIGELERLENTGELVVTIARFVHALQRERGMTNIFLASGGRRFAAMLREQTPECDTFQTQVLTAFEVLSDEGHAVRNGARLFNRIAVVLDGLHALPQLRKEITRCSVAPHDATAAFSRLVAGLLAVVFEAADSAGDPEVSRELVALFHFMQGKEYAGQERAHGAALFASGRVDAAGLQRWRHLVDQQQHCFDVFHEFAHPQLASSLAASCPAETLSRLEGLRQIGQSASATPPREALVDEWYECCTARLDAMRRVEDILAAHLRTVCERKIADARASLRDEQAALGPLHHAPSAPSPALIGPQLGRSVLDMVHEQAQQLQSMGDELEAARTALHERKLVERAKGLLMAHRHLNEDEAYRALRQMAMNQKRRIGEVAQSVLAMAEVLPRSVR